MGNEINKTAKDYSISFVRLIAMLFIIACHILQYYDNELAWWFNVGVQMFFFISGYLHANKEIKDTIGFCGNRFLKILVPYFVCVIITLIFTFALKEKCSVIQIAHLLTVSGSNGFIGLAHLWFVPYILMCYAITPLLLKLKIIGGGYRRSIVKILLVLIGCFVFFEIFANYYNSIWIICYIFGFIYGQTEKVIARRKMVIINIATILLALLTNAFQIYSKYILELNFYGITTVYNCCHVLLGSALVIVLRCMYRTVLNGSMQKLLSCSDKYSYYVYLTHQIFILGTFSMFSIHDSIICGCFATVVCILVSTVLLYLISNRVTILVKGVALSLFK